MTIKGHRGAGIALGTISGTLENCHFSGNVEMGSYATGDGVTALSYAAGICGYPQGSCTVKNCSFSGTVSADGHAGGIIANLYSGTVDSCDVLPGSTVTVSSLSAGGIIGTMSEGSVTNCTADVTISGPGNIGGIIGSVSYNVPRSNISGNKWPDVYPEIGNDANSGSETPVVAPEDPVSPVDDSESSPIVVPGQSIDTKFLDNAFFSNATAVSPVSDYDLQNQLGLTADEIGNSTDGYKVVGLSLPSGVTLSEGMAFFVIIADNQSGTGSRALGVGIISAGQTGLSFLPIVFKLLKNPANTSEYMTFNAGNYFVGATNDTESDSSTADDTGSDSISASRVVLVAADGTTFSLKSSLAIPLQGQTAYGAAEPIESYDEINDDVDWSSYDGLAITASGVPASISDNEDLTFTISGITVTDGKITGVRKTDGTYINDIDHFGISMEKHDENNVNSDFEGYVYPYSVTSDGKIKISFSELARHLAGFSGTKTISYFVDVDGVSNDKGSFYSEYWGVLGSISVDISASAAEIVGETRFEQVVSSQDLTGADSDDTVELPAVVPQRIEITESMRATILEMFASRDIIESEIFSPFDDNGANMQGDPAQFLNTDVDVIYPNSALAALPILSVKTRGAYVFGVSLEDVVNPGTQLTSWAKVANNASVSAAAKRASSTINYAYASRAKGLKRSLIRSAAENSSYSALETMSTIYLNRDGELISEVPEDQFVIIATCCNANTSKGLFVLENNELPWGIVDVLKPEEVAPEHVEQIAAVLSVDAGEVRYLASSDIMRVVPLEPTPAMRSFAAKNKYQFAAKLDTIRVKEKGVYIFKVVIPDELKGINPEKLELFGIDPEALVNNSNPESPGDVEVSVLPPVFAGIGSALDWAAIFGDDYWVVGAVLPAAQPLSMYILKILLMLLAGCDAGAGVGLGVFALIAVCGSFAAFKIFRRK